MRWLAIILLFVSLENLRAGLLDNPMLLVYNDELEDLNPTSNSLSDDISEEVFFYLFTREDPSTRQELVPNDVDSLHLSFFKPQNPTKFVIHGFLDNSNNPMAQSIKDSLLRQEEVNVILVDWGKIAMGIDYIKIAKKTVEVGAYTGQLMEFLVENGAQYDDFHLIGHSLGAHIAGFTGASVKNGTVARITGLDPAKPGFHLVPPEKRLNPSNAKFVDCIHTCAGMLGLTEAICTADFYPNGGKNMQPGCPWYDFGRCSHKRAHRYFTESIDPEYEYPALRCDSLPDDAVDPSSCVPSPVIMGYRTALDTFGIYFVITNERRPFAPIHPYQIV